MRRRDFILLIAGATATWPLAAHAQRSSMPVVGFLNPESPDRYQPMVAAFRAGLKEAGYVEGQNVTIEYRWADGQSERLPVMAIELINHQVAVIAATSTPAAIAAKTTGTTIPIVFETGSDPIKLGLVASLNQPGHNITGVTQLNVEIAPKRLELLHELLPSAKVMALLVNPANPALAEPSQRSTLAAARSLGLELYVLNASADSDLDRAFAKLIESHAGGLVIGGDPFTISRIEQLAALTLRHAVPAVFETRKFAAAGGLMSYGVDIADSYRLTGIYVGQILKGHKPADLPVQQATKVELYINLKTARALGIAIPLPLSGRADEVIE